MVAAGAAGFGTIREREDLLFRLDVVTIDVPPLRQRTQDLAELIAHFLETALAKSPRAVAKRFSAAAMEKLQSYAWPGNVRELEHLVQRAVLLVQTEEVLVTDLPEAIATTTPKEFAFSGPVVRLEEMERRYAAWALEQLGGRRMLTAETLDIDRKTLVKLLG